MLHLSETTSRSRVNVIYLEIDVDNLMDQASESNCLFLWFVFHNAIFRILSAPLGDERSPTISGFTLMTLLDIDHLD